MPSTIKKYPMVLIAILAAGLLAALLFGGTAHAAGLTVTTTADELNVDGDCSLREAIQSANTDTAVDACLAGNGADVITIPAGTYILSIVGSGEDANATGDLDIDSDLTINGAGAGATIIDGGGVDRVFHILTGHTVKIADLTIQNGFTSNFGGGIYIVGVTAGPATLVTINDSTISGNETNNYGGGIYVLGVVDTRVTINNSLFSGNLATNGYGGGIYVATVGRVNINSTVVSSNIAKHGGGIVSNGQVTINDSIISGNYASGIGGGILKTGYRGLTLLDSTVSGNTSIDDGGGIYIVNSNWSVIIKNSTISNNSGRRGGGISAQGAINDIGAVSITNSTISGNSASHVGGGIHNFGGPMTINNSTVTGNVGSGIDHEGDGGTLTIKNTIVANNFGPAPQCSGTGTITSAGHNLVSDGTCGLAVAAGDIPNGTALLGPLQNNGGPTETHALQAGSQAIDAGNPAVPGSGGDACEATDQRGIPRPQGTDCDIGAFEFQPSQLDDDNDGVTNDLDLCPGTPLGAVLDADGCAASQLDDEDPTWNLPTS